MDADVDYASAIVVDAYLLDHPAAFGNTDKSAEAAYAVVNMYYVVAKLKLLYFLERKCHLASSGLFAAQVVLVETVEYLVICEYDCFAVLVDEACMQCA